MNTILKTIFESVFMFFALAVALYITAYLFSLLYNALKRHLGTGFAILGTMAVILVCCNNTRKPTITRPQQLSIGK